MILNFCFHDEGCQVHLTATCKIKGPTQGLIVLSIAYYEYPIIHLLP